jgi:hypothetical protein
LDYAAGQWAAVGTGFLRVARRTGAAKEKMGARPRLASYGFMNPALKGHGVIDNCKYNVVIQTHWTNRREWLCNSGFATVAL